MKHARKLISLLLALVMVAGWLPVQSLAMVIDHRTQASTLPEIEKTRIVHFNPLYPAPDESIFAQLENADCQPASQEDPVYTESLQEAAAVLRQGMVERQNKISVYYLLHKDERGDYEFVDAIFEEALAHTGNPKEGDALRWVYQGWVVDIQTGYTGDYCRFELIYTMVYYTDAQQEAELDAAVEELLDSFDFKESTSDYAKVKQIYDYVTANITYDYAHLYDPTYTLQFTAYAALIHGTAVCQGYSLLMYRLLLEEGIDCRLICSIPEECHAWNIVKLGDYYYNFDSTWDAGLTDYYWFLLSQSDFSRHTRDTAYNTEEFHAQYPMDPVSYDPESSHTHTYDDVVVTPPTCTKEGYTTYTCTVCGVRKFADYTEATGHSFGEGTVNPPTCAMEGHTVYVCAVCGHVHVDDFVEKLPHTYDAGVVTLPTCWEAGYTTFTCTVCGDSYRDHYVPESHDYAVEIKPVTCTDFGYTTHTCTLCGNNYMTDYLNPTGHVLGEDFLCTVCGRPEYVFNSDLYVRNLVADENGVYHNASGDVVYVAVTLQLDQWTVDHTLANQVNGFGEPFFNLTHWDQILASLNEDGCMILTEENLVWMLELLQGNSGTGPEDWRLNFYLCYVLDHNHEYETVITPATCTEFGLTETYCIHCGLVTESESTWYQHSYDDGVVTPATCISNGYTTYTCTLCGDYYTMDYTPYGDHTFDEEGVVTPPTCTSEGYTTFTCTVCGEWFTGEYVDRLEHTPDENCICALCGQKVYVVDCGLEVGALVLGQDGVYYTAYGDMVMIAISAPLDSWLSGDSLADYVEAFGSYYFSMTYWDELLAATNADGYAPLTQDTLVWMLDLITTNPFWGEDESYLTYYLGFPLDHAHTYEIEEVAPTCTEMGISERTCTLCGYYNREYTDPLGHNLDENFVCTVCGARFEYVIDCGLTIDDLILGEDGIYYTAEGYMAVIAVTAPLEIWLGGNSLADYVYVYGDSLFSLTYWAALLEETNEDGYAPLTPITLIYILDVITGNPVWEEDASYLTHYIGYYVRPATCAHSYTEVVTEPTCMGAGFTTYTCTLCGDSYRDNYTDRLEHSYTTTVTEPGCATWGHTTYTCTYCGYCHNADEVEPLGHSYADVVTAPTCTAGGYTTHTCTRCGGSYVDAYTDPVDHSYVDGACQYCGLAEVTTLPGDVNGDGKINTSDAKLIMQYELGLIGADSLDAAAADVNGDGKINTSDAKLVMQMELGLITQFPVQE